MFVDYAETKRIADILQVASWLGITLKNNRGVCPINDGDPRELVVTPEKGLAICFGCKRPYLVGKRGGDSIWLVSHVKQIPLQRAALEIQKHFTGYEPAKKGLPEGGLDYLLYENEHVQALGISPERAIQLGIGYANRGTMIKRILFPVRDTSGKLLGYLGVSPGSDIKLPKSLVQS